jgi:hypothetical protein
VKVETPRNDKGQLVDIRIEDGVSVFLFRPFNDLALEWLQSTEKEAQWFGGAMAVEPRYVFALIQGLKESGFVVNTSL